MKFRGLLLSLLPFECNNKSKTNKNIQSRHFKKQKNQRRGRWPIVDTLLVYRPVFVHDVNLPILPFWMKRQVYLFILFNFKEDV